MKLVNKGCQKSYFLLYCPRLQTDVCSAVHWSRLLQRGCTYPLLRKLLLPKYTWLREDRPLVDIAVSTSSIINSGVHTTHNRLLQRIKEDICAQTERWNVVSLTKEQLHLSLPHLTSETARSLICLQQCSYYQPGYPFRWARCIQYELQQHHYTLILTLAI